MIVYDVARMVLDTESFPQHNIAGLISGITFIVLISHEKPLRRKEINTHTHTHTHTHTQALRSKVSKEAKDLLNSHFIRDDEDKQKVC